MTINNENKTQTAQRDISNAPPGFEEFLEALKTRLEDLLSVEVITATSDFEGEITNPSNLVDSLSRLTMTNTIIHARTQIQIFGDRAQIIPKVDVGTLSQDDIWKHHQKTVEFAECIWLKRMDYLIKLIIALTRIKRDDVQPEDLLYTPVPPPPDNCMSQVLTQQKIKTENNNNPTTESNITT